MAPKPRPALNRAPSRVHPLTPVPDSPEATGTGQRTPTGQGTVMLSVRATRELREQARIYAVREGISLQLLVEQALTEYLAGHAR